MKKSLIIGSVICSLIVAGTSILATMPTFYLNNSDLPKQPIKPQSSLNHQLNVKNYFDNYPGDLKGESLQLELKKQINCIIHRYRLDEWNIYYEKNANKLAKAHVWNFKMSDFSEINKIDYEQNSLVKSQCGAIQTTYTYRTQDPQFRYFNDFINIFNNDGKDIDNDFLYLRWLYYSLSMSKHSHQKVKVSDGMEKSLRDITLTDWATAIAEAVAGNVEIVSGMFEGFVEYYISSAPKAYLCAMDMIMRYGSKPDDEIQRYPQWKPKINRAIEVYKITQEEFNILPNSLVQVDGNEPEFNEEHKEDALAALQKLKDVAATILKEITTLTTINANDYYIKEKN